jgi:hypothetical protein
MKTTLVNHSIKIDVNTDFADSLALAVRALDNIYPQDVRRKRKHEKNERINFVERVDYFSYCVVVEGIYT